MLITLPDLLTADQIQHCRHTLAAATWIDGRATAGHVAAQAKANRQLALDDPLAAHLGAMITDALGKQPLFQAAVLPAHVLPPRFNCYTGGEHYGFHIDNAIFRGAASETIRADVSTTVFLSDPDAYEGGELIIQDVYGDQQVKLPAGHAVVYPSTSLHRVTPVTRGTRYAAFFWTQSLIRDDSQRTLLLQQDVAIQQLIQRQADPAIVARLTGIYHNLVRLWAHV